MARRPRPKTPTIRIKKAGKDPYTEWTVKRRCDGCARILGDATDFELELAGVQAKTTVALPAVLGSKAAHVLLPSVKSECPVCVINRDFGRSFVIPLPIDKPWPEANGSRGMAAQRVVIKKRTEVRDAVVDRCRDLAIPPLAAAIVDLHWVPRTAGRRDTDNAVNMRKPALDGVVLANVIPDDCAPWVACPAPHIYRAQPHRQAPRIWLTVTETAPMPLADLVNDPWAA